MTFRIASLRAGRVRTLEQPAWAHAKSPTWRSAYVKDEVAGPARVGPLGIEGDEQHDRRVHGGPERALLAYGADHYPAWRAELGRDDFGFGALGENLAIHGLDETNVCIGDQYRAGDVVVEVASPRGPCANISRRWNREDLLQRVADSRRTGWYLRVLAPGTLAAADAFERIAQPNPGGTIRRLLDARYRSDRDPVELAALAVLPGLDAEWRERFARLARG